MSILDLVLLFKPKFLKPPRLISLHRHYATPSTAVTSHSTATVTASFISYIGFFDMASLLTWVGVRIPPHRPFEGYAFVVDEAMVIQEGNSCWIHGLLCNTVFLIPCPNLGPTVPQPKFAVRNMHVYKIAQYRTHTKFEIALINTMKFSAVAIGLYDYPSLSLPALPNVKSFFFFFFMFGFSFSVLQLLVCFTVFTVGGWHSFHTAAGHSDLQQP
ncbi:hypothetical protein Bca52824_092488 [Brassica carinata]|uniref:Uncharacterized protein n=1 Tax=Brassica carinata TaxID=52824 RepID=A0A8X7TEM5_BRACI|nr:hypothetical protein Bca52824_092488 [Brassica carinata]